MGSYIPNSAAEQQAMLESLGLHTPAELFDHLPPETRIGALEIPEGKSELEVRAQVEALSEKNRRFPVIFRGAGAYNHYIPSIVRSVTSKKEFATAYTPYQAEISQGVLQSIFEYQTMICQLTGMEVSNASVYDGAVAAAEAIVMCQERKRSRALVSGAVNPQVLTVIRTYCESHGIPMELLPVEDGRTAPAALAAALRADDACVYIQQPNYFGLLEDCESLTQETHKVGAKMILGVDPIFLGLFKTPVECGVDIAVGEGQSLGLPMGFGGPYLGFMACTQAMMRRLPGRIVGETHDAKGNRAYVLTLQAREQHIRREKATSSICSNEALCAMTASVYLAAMGPQGLADCARQCYNNAHYAAQAVGSLPGFALRHTGPFFQEFVTECPVKPKALEALLEKEGILCGQIVDGGILWCVTEMNTKAQIDRLVEILKEVATK